MVMLSSRSGVYCDVRPSPYWLTLLSMSASTEMVCIICTRLWGLGRRQSITFGLVVLVSQAPLIEHILCLSADRNIIVLKNQSTSCMRVLSKVDGDDIGASSASFD